MANLNDLVEFVGVADEFPCLEGEEDHWTQLSVAETLEIPEQKPDMEQIAKVVVEVELISQRVVKTPVSYCDNLAGNKLTGKKLILEGYLRQKVFYVADVPEQSLHVAHFKVPFSTFVVIPKTTSLYSKFRVDPYVEDIFIKMNNNREIFKNITLFLHVIPTDCQCC